MPSLETTITVGIVFFGILAMLHIFASARAGVVLAHQRRYEEAIKSSKIEALPDKPAAVAAEPIEVG